MKQKKTISMQTFVSLRQKYHAFLGQLKYAKSCNYLHAKGNKVISTLEITREMSMCRKQNLLSA